MISLVLGAINFVLSRLTSGEDVKKRWRGGEKVKKNKLDMEVSHKDAVRHASWGYFQTDKCTTFNYCRNKCVCLDVRSLT